MAELALREWGDFALRILFADNREVSLGYHVHVLQILELLTLLGEVVFNEATVSRDPHWSEVF